MAVKIKKNTYRALAFLCMMPVLSACNSTDATLGVDQNSTTPEPLTAPIAATSTQPLQIASTQTNSETQKVYFSPVVGAPVSKVQALSQRLSSVSPTKNISLQPSNSQTIDHEIRGYFSAFSEGGTTTVIHVWDIFSTAGQRVHRIQGQEKVNGTGTDPWAVVPASAMEKIADSVLNQYATWRISS